jgi:hypothetical protein
MLLLINSSSPKHGSHGERRSKSVDSACSISSSKSLGDLTHELAKPFKEQIEPITEGIADTINSLSELDVDQHIVTPLKKSADEFSKRLYSSTLTNL